MGDRSWMQVTIHHCPSKRQEVTELLAEYVGMDTDVPVPVKDDEPYETEEISLGSADELTGLLITLAPRCSFTAVQAAHYTADGDVHHYTPKLGRFDADVDSGLNVMLSYHETTRILAAGAVWGMTMLEAAFEVAYGVPWEMELAGTPVAPARRRAWLAVIDHWYTERTETVIRQVAEFSAKLVALGPDVFPGELAAQSIREAAGPRDLPALAGVLDGLHGALTIARDEGKLGPSLNANWNLPWNADAYAGTLRGLYEGRRRP